MKYKIYDFLQDRYFPRSSDIFIPTKLGALTVLDTLILDGVTDRLAVYFYIYEDSSHEECAKTFYTYEEFIMYTGPDYKAIKSESPLF